MTLDEANRIARLIGYADSACSNCVGNLVTQANTLFPEFKFTQTDETRTDRSGWEPLDDPYPSGPRWIVVTVEPSP